MIEDENHLLLTIPTGWGKSLNAHMLYHYLMLATDEDWEIFSKLKIC